MMLCELCLFLVCHLSLGTVISIKKRVEGHPCLELSRLHSLRLAVLRRALQMKEFLGNGAVVKDPSFPD